MLNRKMRLCRLRDQFAGQDQLFIFESKTLGPCSIRYLRDNFLACQDLGFITCMQAQPHYMLRSQLPEGVRMQENSCPIETTCRAESAWAPLGIENIHTDKTVHIFSIMHACMANSFQHKKLRCQSLPALHPELNGPSHMLCLAGGMELLSQHLSWTRSAVSQPLTDDGTCIHEHSHACMHVQTRHGPSLARHSLSST